ESELERYRRAIRDSADAGAPKCEAGGRQIAQSGSGAVGQGRQAGGGDSTTCERTVDRTLHAESRARGLQRTTAGGGADGLLVQSLQRRRAKRTRKVHAHGVRA